MTSMESFERSSFGYACHNTTAQDFMQFQGDYAGFAQAWLENRHPEATALFISGCGADANPYPRGTVELARQHGPEQVAEKLCRVCHSEGTKDLLFAGPITCKILRRLRPLETTECFAFSATC